MRTNRLIVISIGFILSGFLGLVYEVVWLRKLALIFGTTLPATTAVLAAFMGGLAIGSFVFGRIVDKHHSPLKLYGILEICTGLYCLLTPFIFDYLQAIHIVLFREFGDSFVLHLMRFILASITISIPCMFMGGTLPVLTRSLIAKRGTLRDHIALLYFLNTIGAVFGTLFTGFFLIRSLGMEQVIYLAVAGNVTIGVLFIVISKTDAYDEPLRETTPHSLSRSTHWLLPMYFLIGAIGMGTEVAWFRALNLVIGSTVYAFTILLSAFLLGIALGSLSIKLFSRQRPDPLIFVGGLTIVTGLMIAVSVAVLSRLPVIVLWLFPRFHSNFFVWQSCLFFLGMITVIPATFGLGALFPAVSEAYISEMRRVARCVGNLYLWNTLGGIAGTILTGFVLIPMMGSRTTLIAYSAVCIAMGILVLYKRQTGFQLCILGIVAIVLLAILPTWDRVLFDSGVYLYAPQMKEGFEANRHMLFEEESVHSYVTVSEIAGIRSLRINGKTDGSDGDDLYTQILLAQLPLIHHPNAKNAIIIGLGTGVTLGSALTYPELQAECIEIDPAVIRAASFFSHISDSALSSSRGRIIKADARTVLSSATSQYDIVISEPSNPWISGVSNLFTVEHFLACRESLRNNGIMCQWIHSYYMSPETLLTVISTFQSVFSHCSIWQGSPGDYLLLGACKNFTVDLNQIWLEGLPHAVTEDLKRINIRSADDIIERQLLNDGQLRKMISDHPVQINSDNHPIVEFDSPASLFQNTVDMNRTMIESYSKVN